AARGMEERHAPLPARTEDAQACRGRDDVDAAVRPAPWVAVAAGPPREGRVSEHQERSAVEQDECAVGQILGAPLVQPPPMDTGAEPLAVEAPVELVGAPGPGHGEEAPVVLVPALGAGTMPGGDGGGLVEKEEPGVAARRHRFAPAASELEPACNPPA